jgi:hypothetical protein
MRRIAALLLLVGCTRTSQVRTEEHTASALTQTVAAHERQQVDTASTVTHGPVDETVVVEEYAPVAKDADVAGKAPAGVPDGGQTLAGSVAPTAPPPGRLLRRTTTTIHIAPVVAETHETARSDASSLAQTHATAQAEQHTAATTTLQAGPGWRAYAFGLVVVLLLAVVAFGAWKLRLL